MSVITSLPRTPRLAAQRQSGPSTLDASPIHASPAHPVRLRSRPDASRRHRTDERTRRITSLVVAALGVAALISVLSTPLSHLLHGLFGGGGVVGPITAATSIVFWSVGLLLIGRGLRHGHRLAWALTLTFVGVAASHHAARHDDTLETVLLCAGAVLLVLRRRAFGVRVSLGSTSKALATVGVGLALGAVARMYRHDPHAFDPGGTANGHHSGSAAAAPLGFGEGVGPTFLLVFGLVLLVVVLWGFLSPRRAQRLPEPTRRLERERARSIVATHGQGTLDYFALRDDKRWFFHEHSVVAYAVRFGACLVSPDPIGPADERREVWAAFLEHVRGQGWSVSVLGAGAEWLEVYRSFGLHPVYLGEEAVVDCTAFSLDGRAMRSLRQACNRVDRAGYTVTFHDPADLDENARRELLELATVSREGKVERGFSMTLSRIFDAEDTGLLLSVTRDEDGRARAFVQWMPAPGIHGWSLDVMRYDTGPDVPNGVMDHLIVQTIRHLVSRGEVGLGLNFAVVRNLVATEPTTPAGQLGQRLLHAVSGRTEIASLCRYNEKFGPTWQPRYVVLDAVDTLASQGLVIAAAEGLSELPVIGRFMTGVGR